MLGLICIATAFVTTAGNAQAQYYPPVTQPTPVFKAGPYMTALGPSKFRLKMQVTTFNPQTMTMAETTFSGPTGFPDFTIQQSVPMQPMNYSWLIHKLDEPVTNPDALTMYNGGNVVMTQGIVEYSANGTSDWIYHATIGVDHVLLPPVP